MPNPYVGSAIAGCTSPTVGADKDTYTGTLDTMAEKLDGHDHTTGKGNPIGTNAISDLAVSAAKLAADAVETAKIKDLNVTLAKLAAEVLSTFVPPGVVLPYASEGAAPTGYLACDGSSVLRTTYPALFTAIGTLHGAADGTHFNLPDYRGRFLRGRDAAQARDPDAGSRTAMATGGSTGDHVGTLQAAATARPATTAFTTDNPGTHTHAQIANTAAATGFSNKYPIAGGDGGSTVTENPTAAGGAHTHTITGGGDTETRPINIAVAYIIKT